MKPKPLSRIGPQFNSHRYWEFRLKSEDKDNMSKDIDITGTLSFKWPYVWEEEKNIQWSIIDSVTEDICSWLKKGLSSNDVPFQLIRDTTTFAYMTLPSTWGGFDVRTKESVTHYQKVLLYAKFHALVFIIDDIAENLAGSPGFDILMEEMAESSYSIFMLKYRSYEEIFRDLEKYESELKSPVLASKNVMWLDLAQELETVYGYTSRETQYFAQWMHSLWDYHTWLGSSDYSHKVTAEDQRYFRPYTGGGFTTFELVLLIENLHVSEEQRRRKYWLRFASVLGELIHFSNDILSYMKEVRENTMDNYIMALMRDNLGMEEAVSKCCEEHDKCLEILRGIWLYFQTRELKRCPVSLGEEGFIRALDAGNYFAGHFIQAQYCMKRYTQFTFRIVDENGEPKHSE